MSDELRDRIADQIMPASVREIDEAAGRAALAVAGKIIDDLGLTVEERFVYATDLARHDEPVTDDMAQRVVGRWETK